ncbi:hypothetical protein P154DRAFT_579793 [Amniculicola lignicola CBS 123094]|uniref:Sin3 binding protein-domain-containing protein n=1 Tax=Amniculicola lignicola CBS 123094 TaxID=1392246 RepID=A0A6A5W8V3_9PLEO|nr:hypothetical protein P154DRAFT_579793 [Amniculicola lignicola CBS 123094]
MATAPSSRPVSNIAVAFAAHHASNNIPILREGGLASAPDHRGMLPTPPNSISPTLAARKHRAEMPMAATPPPPAHVDSDIDLQDAVEHAAAQDQPGSALSREALAGLEAAGQITPTMLAKQHLPGIFLLHGSMPIRDIMHHLAQSVPGYSTILPAKARRIVVAALENRAGGGYHGEMVFEKVGWGRWTGHLKGQSPQPARGVPIGKHGASHSGPTPPASVDSAGGLQLPKWNNHHDAYSGSWAAGSMVSSRDEEMADRMSLDGSESSGSDTSEMDLGQDDMDDDTDQEDWSTIGPDALRERSRARPRVYRDYNYLSRTSGAKMRSVSAQSVPFSHAGTTTPAFNTSVSYYSASRGNTGTLPASSGVLGTGQNTQEREAVEALLAMTGSM